MDIQLYVYVCTLRIASTKHVNFKINVSKDRRDLLKLSICMHNNEKLDSKILLVDIKE